MIFTPVEGLQMSKEQTWMKIHSGLNEPKHREALGVRIWYFMYLIDNADWDTGVVWHYTDQTAADEMEAPLRTIRNWRRDVEAAGYITAKQGYQCQHIYIHKWCNPRLKNPKQQNVPDRPETWLPKVVTHPYPVLVTHPTRKVVTPTYGSQLSHSSSEDATAKLSDVERKNPDYLAAFDAVVETRIRDVELGSLFRGVDVLGLPIMLEAIRRTDLQNDPSKCTGAYLMGTAQGLARDDWQETSHGTGGLMLDPATGEFRV